MAMYNRINCKFQQVIIMHFYRLVWFHIWRRFRVSLYIRVSNSDQHVAYARQFFTKNPGHKIYSFVSAGSTRHYILLHDPMIIHTKKYFKTARHLHKKISSKKNCHILHCYIHRCFKRHRPLLYIPSSRIIFLLVVT